VARRIKEHNFWSSSALITFLDSTTAVDECNGSATDPDGAQCAVLLPCESRTRRTVSNHAAFLTRIVLDRWDGSPLSLTMSPALLSCVGSRCFIEAAIFSIFLSRADTAVYSCMRLVCVAVSCCCKSLWAWRNSEADLLSWDTMSFAAEKRLAQRSSSSP
jgi:hypothetical protein